MDDDNNMKIKDVEHFSSCCCVTYKSSLFLNIGNETFTETPFLFFSLAALMALFFVLANIKNSEEVHDYNN